MTHPIGPPDVPDVEKVKEVLREGAKYCDVCITAGTARDALAVIEALEGSPFCSCGCHAPGYGAEIATLRARIASLEQAQEIRVGALQKAIRRIAALEEAARTASHDVKIARDRIRKGGFATQDRLLELIADALDQALAGGPNG